VLAVPSPAAGQIVNLQGRLARPPADDTLDGRLEAKVDARSGNHPILDLGGSFELLARRGRVLGLVVAQGGYVRSRGVTLARRAGARLPGSALALGGLRPA
jgi:hypothetical protein